MRFGWLAASPMVGVALACATGTGAAQERIGARDEPLEARVWLDRGANAVLRRGDLVRVFYRASRDAYVSILHIDTNGFARLLHPRSPTDDHFAAGGRDYRVLYPDSRYWRVDEDEGKGYLFVVASGAPLDVPALAYSRHGGGWDLAAVTPAGYRDPFLMMDDVIATLVPEWRSGAYALDFVSYDIDRPHDVPRFLCYECHGFMPMFDWNPYDRWCADFRVVIHDDPYYYPLYRYRGDRVVYTRPLAPARPMFEFKARESGEAATPLIRTRLENAAAGPGFGAGDAAALGEGIAPTARVPGPRLPLERSAGAGAAAPGEARVEEGRDERPVLRRRGEPPPTPRRRPPGRPPGS